MPSPLLNLATLALVASPAVATSSYNLLYKFDQTNFFQNFSFYSDPDPTGGYVNTRYAWKSLDADDILDSSSTWIMMQPIRLALRRLTPMEMSTSELTIPTHTLPVADLQLVSCPTFNSTRAFSLQTLPTCLEMPVVSGLPFGQPAPTGLRTVRLISSRVSTNRRPLR
jgi:hypothetical protein